MTERARATFDTQAVAKALGTQAQAVTDPAYGEEDVILALKRAASDY